MYGLRAALNEQTVENQLVQYFPHPLEPGCAMGTERQRYFHDFIIKIEVRRAVFHGPTAITAKLELGVVGRLQ